jgi:hypothetical protein
MLLLPVLAMAQDKDNLVVTGGGARPQRPVKAGIAQTLKTFDFELAGQNLDILPRAAPVIVKDAPVTEKLADVDLRQAAKVRGQKPFSDEDRRQPYRAFMPSLSGLTGLIDIPVAYTQPKKKYVVTVQHERVRADNTWWRLPYQSIVSDMTYASINFGATPNIELSLDGENWDKDIRYNDPLLFTNPLFTTRDKSFIGFGGKWTFPFSTTGIERMWVGIGGRIQLYDNNDIHTTEVHEYDRFQQFFMVASTKATRELFGHFMLKYVSYDLSGGRPASGATPFFVGFSPQNAWTQWGLGIEYYLFPDFEIFTELLNDSSTIFLDIDSTFNHFNWNVGARYHRENIGVGFFAKRINHRGLKDQGLQFAVRF